MSYRSASRVARAATQRQYYRAVVNIARYFERPFEVLRRYLTFSDSGYPRVITAKTPTGAYPLELYSPDDLVTAVECFAKLDYRVDRDVDTVVDMGSNIGISAAYFLSRNPTVRAFLFEPVPRNVSRLERNLAPFRDRYTLDVAAVGTAGGTATFGCEPTGRYGGIGLELEDSITVEVRDANEVLDRILAAEGRIDVLKLDVEGMEVPILGSLEQSVLERTRTIFAETDGEAPSLPGFARRDQGAVSIYRRSAG